MRTRCLAAVIVGIVWCLAAPAHADPRADIAAKARAAMASYDAMDYEAARRLLNQALAIAKKAKLDKDPIVARVYLDLGIAQLAGSDQEAAKVAFLSAVQIDPKITIDAAYKSTELVRMLDEAKAAAGDGAEPVSEAVDCKAIRGIRHTVIDTGRTGVAQSIEVLVGSDLSPARVVVMYRPEGAIDFVEAKLFKQGGCRYAGTIPASAMHGSLVHYYIAAYDANNKALAAKGSSGAPNIMSLGSSGKSGSSGSLGSTGSGSGDTEDPINGGKASTAHGGNADTGVSAGLEDGGKPPKMSSKIVLAIAAGTGLGYVTGTTESGNKVQSCCIGTSLVVLVPELSYYLNPKLSIGLVARLGLPVGANIMGHSTIAPGVLFRVRRAFSASGDGLRVMGELGGGILRNTLKIDTTATGPGMDTDIVAQGPLLVGAGIGYTKHISGNLAFLIDVDAIAGIALVKSVGSAINLNSGIGADMSLGLAVGF
jgi:hypothetical protein